MRSIGLSVLLALATVACGANGDDATDLHGGVTQDQADEAMAALCGIAEGRGRSTRSAASSTTVPTRPFTTSRRSRRRRIPPPPAHSSRPSPWSRPTWRRRTARRDRRSRRDPRGGNRLGDPGDRPQRGGLFGLT